MPRISNLSIMNLPESPDTGVGWTKGRLRELAELHDMLGELRQINYGSGAIQRLLKCVQVAQELSTTDYSVPRKSFLLFLEDMARPDHPAKVSTIISSP